MTLQKLLTTYHKLPEQLKALMRLKALLYFKIPIETWRACFYSLTYLFPTKTPLSISEFNALVDLLKAKKLLDRDSVFTQDLNHALTLDALNSEQAQQYLQALETGAAKLKHRFYTHDSFGSEKINRFRLSLYTLETGDYSDYVQKHASSEVTGWLQRFFLKEPLEISWLKTRFLDVQRSILNLKLASFCATGFLADQMPDLLGHYLPLRETEAYLPFDPIFLMYDMWAGNTKKAAQTLSPVLATVEEENPSGTTLRGILAFLEGNNDEALSYFEDALKSLRKLTNKKKVLLGRQETIFYALALFKANNRQNHSKIKTLLTLAAELMPRPYDIFANLSKVLLKLQGLESKVAFEAFKFDRVEDPVSRAIGALASFWFDEKQVDKEKCQEQFLRHQTLLPLIGKIYRPSA